MRMVAWARAYRREMLGEFLGTFLLVLFGCGAVAGSILFSAHPGLLQVALVWGIGVSLAIYATRHLSCAHLNPAVSLAMVTAGRMEARKLLPYLISQFAGAALAGVAILLLFGPSIAALERSEGILRGSAESIRTARMFGEFYRPLTGPGTVSLPLAVGAETFGTFLLILLIFSLTEGCNLGRPHDGIAPLFIGLTVASVICLVAPLTQAGLNPARDFAPRIVAALAGWGKAAFPDDQGGFFFVYIAGPVLGGQAAAFIFARIIQPCMKGEKIPCCPDGGGSTDQEAQK